jgi:hypothetical protein
MIMSRSMDGRGMNTHRYLTHICIYGLTDEHQEHSV